MRVRRKILGGFLLRLVLCYTLASVAWPFVQEVYSSTFHRVCRALPGEIGPRGRMVLLDRAAEDGDLDVRFLIGRTDTRVTKIRRMSSYFTGYLPTVFLLSLISSTPIPWSRRGRALFFGLLLLHGFMGFKIAYAVYSVFVTDADIGLATLEAWQTSGLVYLNAVLNESALTLFSSPVVIWALVSFRRGDEALVFDRLPDGMEPRTAGRAGSALRSAAGQAGN